MKYTDSELLNRVQGLDSFNRWPNGVLDIWIRSRADQFDAFDDKVYSYEFAGEGTPPRFVMACTGTSNAGAEGLLHFEKYNREGCAILKADEIVYYSHGYGLHKGKYPAYVQVKPFPYYRDNNKNQKAEEIGPIHNDIIGANCHKAGWFSTHIGAWSVACLVRNQEAQFNQWMDFMSKRLLTVCILNEF